MASKKDFTAANTGRVYDAISEATAEPEPQEEPKTRAPRKTYTGEQILEMQRAGKTQGRKGCKAVRINMAFAPEVHDYIRRMARYFGLNVTEFANLVFRQNMELNKQLYEEIQNNSDELIL